jgi:hypothetical protein
MQLDIADDKVRSHTAPKINDRIDRQLERNVGYMATQSKESLDQRIAELETEWDVDRLLARNAAVLALTGTVFSFFNRSWLILPLAVTSFLFNHMQKGWCPPLPVLRRLGVRTLKEIEVEKYALKAMRGDFQDISLSADPTEKTRQALAASCRNGHSAPEQ